MARLRLSNLPSPLRSVVASLTSNLTWVEERTLMRLEQVNRFEPGTIPLLGSEVSFIDGASTASAYRAIFGDEVYAFQPSSETPAIIDGGANIGLAALYWKRLLPRSRIHCLEPDEVAFEALARNVETFGMSPISLLRAAVWIENGHASFARSGGDAGHLDPTASGPLVETVSLSSLLDQSVDYLKLDIEGAEADVLLSAADSLRNVSHMFVEYHSFVGVPQRLGEILELLSYSGFRYWVQTEYAPTCPVVEPTADAGMDLRVNILAARR